MCGIGFADLSGFTVLTRALDPAQLSYLLNEFAGTVADVVHRDGGRVVKFIGDEVMWVSASPERLARAAVDLVEHPRAREEGLQVRAGLAYGAVLAINGDYFGSPVNLAARLVGAAAPSQILADSALHEQLPQWPATARGPFDLKGFDDPVVAFELHGGAPPTSARAPAIRVTARDHRIELSQPRRQRRRIAAETPGGLFGVDRAGGLGRRRGQAGGGRRPGRVAADRGRGRRNRIRPAGAGRHRRQ